MHPIKKYCSEKRITLKAFSVLAGISAPFVTQITKGKRHPSPSQAIKIKEIIGISDIEHLLFYKEETNSEFPASSRRPVEQ